MGLFDFFKPRKTEVPKPQLLETQEQAQSRQSLGNYLNTYGGSSLAGQGALYRPYSGRFTAEMSPTETQGMSMLSNWLGSQSPAILETAQDQLEATLSGQYDPLTSPYYKSARAELAAQQERDLQALGRSQQMRGMYRSTPGAREEALAREGFQRAGNSLMGSLYEQERGRTMNAIPQAYQLAQLRENIPMSRIGAAMGYGSIPRSIEQSNIDKQYVDFLRQLTGEQGTLSMLQQIMGEPTYYQQQYRTTLSPLQSLVSTLNPIYGDVLRGQGANAPGMSTADLIKILAKTQGGMG